MPSRIGIPTSTTGSGFVFAAIAASTHRSRGVFTRSFPRCSGSAERLTRSSYQSDDGTSAAGRRVPQPRRSRKAPEFVAPSAETRIPALAYPDRDLPRPVPYGLAIAARRRDQQDATGVAMGDGVW